MLVYNEAFRRQMTTPRHWKRKHYEPSGRAKEQRKSDAITEY